MAVYHKHKPWQLDLQDGGISLLAPFSSDPAKASLRGKEWQVDEARSYADFNTMAKSEAMRDDGIEAVMITTPNNAHFPAAEAFIEQGIDIICDKPLTNSLSEAEKLEQLTKEKSRFCGMLYYVMLSYGATST